MNKSDEIKMSPVTALPDGSGCFTASFPLPKDHWLYAEGYNTPPMPLRMRAGEKKRLMAGRITEAVQYAVRASTMNGKEMDFDPDAMVQNMLVGLLGYWTDDGLGSEDWENPTPTPPEFRP